MSAILGYNLNATRTPKMRLAELMAQQEGTYQQHFAENPRAGDLQKEILVGNAGRDDASRMMYEHALKQNAKINAGTAEADMQRYMADDEAATAKAEADRVAANELKYANHAKLSSGDSMADDSLSAQMAQWKATHAPAKPQTPPSGDSMADNSMSAQMAQWKALHPPANPQTQPPQQFGRGAGSWTPPTIKSTQVGRGVSSAPPTVETGRGYSTSYRMPGWGDKTYPPLASQYDRFNPDIRSKMNVNKPGYGVTPNSPLQERNLNYPPAKPDATYMPKVQFPSRYELGKPLPTGPSIQDGVWEEGLVQGPSGPDMAGVARLPESGELARLQKGEMVIPVKGVGGLSDALGMSPKQISKTFIEDADKFKSKQTNFPMGDRTMKPKKYAGGKGILASLADGYNNSGFKRGVGNIVGPTINRLREDDPVEAAPTVAQPTSAIKQQRNSANAIMNGIANGYAPKKYAGGKKLKDLGKPQAVANVKRYSNGKILSDEFRLEDMDPVDTAQIGGGLATGVGAAAAGKLLAGSQSNPYTAGGNPMNAFRSGGSLAARDAMWSSLKGWDKAKNLARAATQRSVFLDAALETMNDQSSTPTEDYYKRFGFGTDNYTGSPLDAAAKDIRVRALGAASDLAANIPGAADKLYNFISDTATGGAIGHSKMKDFVREKLFRDVADRKAKGTTLPKTTFLQKAAEVTGLPLAGGAGSKTPAVVPKAGDTPAGAGAGTGQNGAMYETGIPGIKGIGDNRFVGVGTGMSSSDEATTAALGRLRNAKTPASLERELYYKKDVSPEDAQKYATAKQWDMAIDDRTSLLNAPSGLLGDILGTGSVGTAIAARNSGNGSGKNGTGGVMSLVNGVQENNRENLKLDNESNMKVLEMYTKDNPDQIPLVSTILSKLPAGLTIPQRIQMVSDYQKIAATVRPNAGNPTPDFTDPAFLDALQQAYSQANNPSLQDGVTLAEQVRKNGLSALPRALKNKVLFTNDTISVGPGAQTTGGDADTLAALARIRAGA